MCVRASVLPSAAIVTVDLIELFMSVTCYVENRHSDVCDVLCLMFH